MKKPHGVRISGKTSGSSTTEPEAHCLLKVPPVKALTPPGSAGNWVQTLAA